MRGDLRWPLSKGRTRLGSVPPLTKSSRLRSVSPKKNPPAHSSVTITLDTYSHVLPDMQDNLAIAAENLLKRS